MVEVVLVVSVSLVPCATSWAYECRKSAELFLGPCAFAQTRVHAYSCANIRKRVCAQFRGSLHSR